MRLYYSFVTGIAAWVGMACYEHWAGCPVATGTRILILVIGFLGWGVNQVINDYLGLREDRINAPQRPMVTGRLNPGRAPFLSGLLILLSGLATALWLQPSALVLLVSGVALNVVYEKAKGHGVLGNFVFGLMISMATLFGFFASGTFAVPEGLRRMALFPTQTLEHWVRLRS
jgi:geranylgeranylglycerol-phosphate geranylgeranyltransferase